MLVVIKKIDSVLGSVEGESMYGKLTGYWCAEPLPLLNREYNIEIDIPQIIASKGIAISTKQNSCFATIQGKVTVSGRVIDQDDYCLTLQVGHDLLLIEVDFTAVEWSLLDKVIEFSAERLNMYDMHITP